MKKFIFILLVMFMVSLGCKKIDNSGGLCSCSPIYYPYLSLVIKNAAGDDFLNTNTAGSFTKDKIQLYSKETSGGIKQIQFLIRQPFSYGSDQFKYFHLRSEGIIAALNNSPNTVFYIKLGDNPPYELKIQINTNKIDKLLIDNNEAVKETGKLSNYMDGNIFYLTL